MVRSRFFWVGMHLSVVGIVVVFIAQSSPESWRVEASCQDGSVMGSITAEPGSHTIEVFVTFHVPGDSDWLEVPGASQTLIVEGTGPHSFGPLDVSATPPEANSIRVELDVRGNPTNEKSESFKPCAPSATPTQPSDTPTQPSDTPTQPSGTATQPSGSATQPSGTATQPPATRTPRPTQTPRASATTPPGSTLAPTLISEVGGTVTLATVTATPEAIVLGPPGSGDGGLLARHRTSLTVLGAALVFLGVTLIAARGMVDARHA